MDNHSLLQEFLEAITRSNVVNVQDLLNDTIHVHRNLFFFLRRYECVLVYHAVNVCVGIAGPFVGIPSSSKQSLTVLEMLLKVGANANAKYDGLSMLQHVMKGGGNQPVLSILLKYGADPNLKSDQGHTVLHQIVSNLQVLKEAVLKQEEVVQAHAHPIRLYFKTAIKCLELLLLWGADPSIPNDVGRMPLEYSEEFGGLIRSIQADMLQTARCYNLITSEGTADSAALRAFLELPGKERRSWITVSSGLAKGRSLPQELVYEINSWAFTPALGKYRFSLAAWRTFHKPTLLTQANHPITLKFK